MGICLGRWPLGVGASIAAASISLAAATCDSAPGDLKAKIPGPWGPGEFERRYERDGPAVPLPPGWTPDGQHNLCFEHKGNEYCVTICVAVHSGTDCVYIRTDGGCDEGSGWIKYCPSETTENFSMLAAGPDCTTTIGTVSYDLLTGLTDVDVTVVCQNWVDEDLVGVFIAHPSTPSTFLDSDTFRSTYGDYMPADSKVQFSGSAEETAWNTFLLKAEFVEFETTTGDDVASAIHVNAGTDIPPFAVTVVNGQIVDVRAIYDPR